MSLDNNQTFAFYLFMLLEEIDVHGVFIISSVTQFYQNNYKHFPV